MVLGKACNPEYARPAERKWKHSKGNTDYNQYNIHRVEVEKENIQKIEYAYKCCLYGIRHIHGAIKITHFALILQSARCAVLVHGKTILKTITVIVFKHPCRMATGAL